MVCLLVEETQRDCAVGGVSAHIVLGFTSDGVGVICDSLFFFCKRITMLSRCSLGALTVQLASLRGSVYHPPPSFCALCAGCDGKRFQWWTLFLSGMLLYMCWSLPLIVLPRCACAETGGLGRFACWLTGAGRCLPWLTGRCLLWLRLRLWLLCLLWLWLRLLWLLRLRLRCLLWLRLRLRWGECGAWLSSVCVCTQRCTPFLLGTLL